MWKVLREVSCQQLFSLSLSSSFLFLFLILFINSQHLITVILKSQEGNIWLKYLTIVDMLATKQMQHSSSRRKAHIWSNCQNAHWRKLAKLQRLQILHNSYFCTDLISVNYLKTCFDFILIKHGCEYHEQEWIFEQL